MVIVYRRGAQDVHAAPIIGGTRRDINACNLDPTSIPWSPVRPPGPRCSVCFAGLDDEDKRDAKRGSPMRRASTVAGLATAVVIGTALAYPLDTPLWIGTMEPSNGATGSESVAPGAPTPSAGPEVSPGPSGGLPGPTGGQSPVPTQPSVLPTFPPVPTFPPIPTYPPAPTWPPLPPLPTFPPLPTLPLPTLPPGPLPTCTHPGVHGGVKDICKWPGNN